LRAAILVVLDPEVLMNRTRASGLALADIWWRKAQLAMGSYG
jgi:hypothetical protein